MFSDRLSRNAGKAALAVSTFVAALGTSAVTIPNVPLSAQQSVKPMVMLVAGKDHRFFYEAYNDASDVDGDGTLDIRFKPSITYLGLFTPDICYRHANGATNDGLFEPQRSATALNKCVGGGWSGNWLNYVTTSRIDALRVVLYGGHREVDSNSQTILRRAYIPQDAHSWAKEYTSLAVDGYSIADYTPISQPAADRRHFFGNVTANASVNCANLRDCSDLPPWLSVVVNSPKRVWEWASTERPVLADGSHGGARTNRTVRVLVCASTFNSGCKRYPDGAYKPVGLLHDYGESDSMLFGLLTASYDRSLSGGRLRKVVSSFRDEVDLSSGRFTAGNTIVRTFDSMRIRDFNNGRTDQAYRGGWVADRPINSGEMPDWGNPIAEMMYEGVRYFAGKSTATNAYAGATTVDAEVGMPSAAWDDPYSALSAAKAPICARANLLAISDINVSYDSDELPGVYPGFGGSFASDLTGLDVSNEASFISANEPFALGLRFIGQSGPLFDSAPSPKSVTDLGQIRGLAPEEPTKQGSYYAASVAHFAKRLDLRPDKAGKQTVETFVVALASPLPRIEAKLPNGKVVTLVPFAKSVAGLGISNLKGQYQPTNQIVDFYVEQIANSGLQDVDAAVNGGRYFAKFRINYEDVEQGADHDMDAIVEYTVTANSDSTLSVLVKPIYEAGGIQHRMGYIISGTTKDGVYLVVQDEADLRSYFLNTPPNRDPGYCDVATPPADCIRLPYLGGAAGNNASDRVFTPASVGAAATLLKDPLWYAAKWGGFTDRNANDKPDLPLEWDADGDGVPDSYLLVQNPLKLKESLKKMLDTIVARSSSASNISANSTSISGSSLLYQAVFNTQRWSGNVRAYPIIATGFGATPAWDAAAVLPAWGSRKLFMRDSAGTTSLLTNYASLSSTDQALFSSRDVFDYVRGDRSKEILYGGVMRDRENALGDIVHSSPSFEKSTDVLYVGANNGMLHALNASTGVELFAFTPRAVVGRMKNVAALNYVHEYMVDGDILVTPRTSLTSNKNYLFASLGRGGKGLFALNVTNPATFGLNNFLWEYTPAADSTAAVDPDLGLMLGRATFTKLNNGKSGLIVGNGFNSAAGKAVLYVFILNADGSLDSIKKVDTGVSGDNGLSAPTFADTNNDGTADVVYAGDLKGNVWKFDISSASSAGWSVALAGVPLYVAKDVLDVGQPITAPIYSAVNDKSGDPNFGKRFVFFGTGAYFRSGDAADAQQQTWYGVIDENAVVSSRAMLRQRTIAQVDLFGGSTARAFSAGTAGDMTGKKGWYVDMNAPAVGERFMTASKIVRFAVPALVATSLFPVPADPCVPGGTGYLNLIDPYSGAGLGTGVFDVNNNNSFVDDKLGTNFIGSVDLGIGVPSEAITSRIGKKILILIGGSGTAPPQDGSATGGAGKTVKTGLGAPDFRGRISWREIVRD